MKLSARIQSAVEDGFRVPAEWATAAKALEDAVEVAHAALADKAMLLERCATMRDQREEARDLCRQLHPSHVHDIDVPGTLRRLAARELSSQRPPGADDIEDGYCFGCGEHCSESQLYHCCKTFFCDGCSEEEPSHDPHAPSAHLSKAIQAARDAESEDL